MLPIEIVFDRKYLGDINAILYLIQHGEADYNEMVEKGF